MLVEKTKRIYLPKDFNISDWDSLEPIYDELLARNISSFDEFRSWLNDLNELESAMEEEYAWCYIAYDYQLRLMKSTRVITTT